jgi:hypothetical protein
LMALADDVEVEGHDGASLFVWVLWARCDEVLTCRRAARLSAVSAPRRTVHPCDAPP